MFDLGEDGRADENLAAGVVSTLLLDVGGLYWWIKYGFYGCAVKCMAPCFYRTSAARR